MIILRVEVVDLFYPPSCDRPQPIPVFFLFHELSILERSIAIRRACFFFLNISVYEDIGFEQCFLASVYGQRVFWRCWMVARDIEIELETCLQNRKRFCDTELYQKLLWTITRMETKWRKFEWGCAADTFQSPLAASIWRQVSCNWKQVKAGLEYLKAGFQ